MDDSAEKVHELESQQLALENYLNHPVTLEVLRDLDGQAETLTHQILEIPVTDLESFLKREQSLGHLRGLRHAKSRMRESLETVMEELKELRG